MKKLVLISVMTTVSISMSGCGWLFGDKGVFRDRGDNYRRARVEKPLEVPPELTHAEAEQDFAIPMLARSAPLEGKFEVPRPASLDGDPGAEQVRIRNLDNTSWILVEATPGEVWPRVRQFLNTNQLNVARANATDGIIETAWMQPKADGTPRERYRFRIEQGVQRGSSEVYVLQAGAAAGDNWPATSSNVGREEEMVKALAQFIADNGSTGAVSMLAQRGIESKGKVFLGKQAGESYLHLELPTERAWSSLTLALPKAGFTVEDQNQTDRQLWVRYTPPVDPKDKPGMWSRFWTWVWGSEDELGNAKTMYVVRVKPVAANSDTAVTIELSREDGKPIAAPVEKELLNRIKNKLS